MSDGLAITGATLDGEVVGLRAEDGVIATLGPGVSALPGDELIEADGLAIVPGMVNAHTHAAMTLFRGYADDLPLMQWLEDHIWPAERRLEPTDVYWGARLACLEMIRSGTVCFWDMYWHAAETARAAADAGIRAVVGAPLIAPDASSRALADAERSIEQVAELDHPLVEPALAPHAIYSVAPEVLERTAQIANERGLALQIHLSETEAEVVDCVAAHGVRPAVHLDRLGVLGPRAVLAHGVWLDRDELDLIAAREATVVSNPVANMKLGVGGVFPLTEARERGVALGLGTDGAGSNNSLDLFADSKALALVQKHAASDPAAITAAEVLEIARGQQSPLLGGKPVALGAAADFLLVDASDPALVPGDLETNLVYSGRSGVVDTTVVAGRVLMRRGEVDGEAEVVAMARERFDRLLGAD